jgi:hypothetical protein
LVTARTRTSHNDIKIREFKTITGVVSFLVGIGFSDAGIPLEEGLRTTHQLAGLNEGSGDQPFPNLAVCTSSGGPNGFDHGERQLSERLTVLKSICTQL